MRRLTLLVMVGVLGMMSFRGAAAEIPANLETENLVAWCIVPFDAKKRGPAERAQMLRELGIRRCAYDWRAEHVDSFEQEILQYKKHGIEFFAFWGSHDKAFELFKKHGLRPQIWQTLASPNEGTQEEKVEAAAKLMEPLARRTAEMGCQLGLYAHGGWGGEPRNLVAVCRRLREMGHEHVGVVYNWHHGHDHIEDWAASLALMKPYLLCLNLNGMNSGAKPKILALGRGEHDAAMLRTLIDSGYAGPIGIIDHQVELDAREALKANLDGVERLKRELMLSNAGASDVPGRAPLDLAAHPSWQAHVNRDRIYDFYAKQALQYGSMEAADVPQILPPYPGLDGGSYGHWGNQNDEQTWKDSRVRAMDHGAMVSGVFRGVGRKIPRAVAVRLGDGFNAVFNQDTLMFEAAWRGELVNWSDVRRGVMHGIPMGSEVTVPLVSADKSAAGSRYLGLYRIGDRIVFAYSEHGRTRYRTATMKDDKIVESFVEDVTPAGSRWPQRIVTAGRLGDGEPYAIDTLALPYDNPWNALLFVTGVDFISPGRIAICTLHGDVWIVDVVKDDLSELRWKRYAAGLHQPLGLKVVDGVIHVMCRDQIVALHDHNGDDEADFYQCVSNAHVTSAGGHDFITGLQRDDGGRWYFASGNQGLCRVSADGERLEVLATGFRNPNGLGITPDGGVILTSVQEGTWTPASAICEVVEGGHYGAGGPRSGEPGHVQPMLYLARGMDNSSGGQAYIDSNRWGPVRGHWVHFSYGFATHFLVLREVIDGQSQAAAVVLSGEFLSGAHRGRFSPYDGQLYVAAAQGWGSYGVEDGGLQRVRFTGGTYPYPIAYETRDNGILLTFAQPQSAEIADAGRWFAQQWNYLYGPAYGSPELSVRHPNVPGHDRLHIRSVQRLEGGTRLFIEIPQLQPVHQLHLHFAGTPRIELFATVHRLGKPFTGFPGYQRIEKQPRIQPIASTATEGGEMDLTMLMSACTACHHPTQRVMGPPFSEIRERYAGNVEGIVQWAISPEIRDPKLPPMPSFKFLGEEKLRRIAREILAE